MQHQTLYKTNMNTSILLLDITNEEVLSWIEDNDEFKDITTIEEFYSILFSLNRDDVKHSNIDDVEHCIFIGFFDQLQQWKDHGDSRYNFWYNYGIEIIKKRHDSFDFHTYYNEIVNEIQFALDKQLVNKLREELKALPNDVLDKIHSFTLDDCVLDYGGWHEPSRSFTMITDQYNIDMKWFSAKTIHDIITELLKQRIIFKPSHLTSKTFKFKTNSKS